MALWDSLHEVSAIPGLQLLSQLLLSSSESGAQLHCWAPGELIEIPAGQPTAGFGLEESRLPRWQPVQNMFGSPGLASDFLFPQRRRIWGTPALQKSCPGTAALCEDVKNSLTQSSSHPAIGVLLFKF